MNQTEIETRLGIALQEERRVAAAIAEDLPALDGLLDDRLTYVHSAGYVHDKGEYLNFLRDRIKTLSIRRSKAPILRLLDNVAISTGPLEQELERKVDGTRVEIHAIVTQVWAKSDDGWKLLHLHSSKIAT